MVFLLLIFVLARKFAEALLPFFNDKDSTFIISSDFCHWGRRFGYTFIDKEWFSDNNYFQSIDKLDHLAMESISTLNPVKYKEYTEKYKNTVLIEFLFFLDLWKKGNLYFTSWL